MNERDALKIIHEVNVEAEAFYPEAVALGEHVAYAFTKKRVNKNDHRAQMTGLENIAENALKYTDIFDYIKRQTARHEHWRETYPQSKQPNKGYGERLLAYLGGNLKDNAEDNLQKRRDEVCKRLGFDTETYEHKQRQRHIYLLLIRQFIRHMVVHYEYYMYDIRRDKKDQEHGVEN